MIEPTPRYRILLVDDREENLFALQDILENEHYEFLRATSGREALALLLNDVDFHLIILDVLMPTMSGFETASYIYQREKLQNIPIIFLTALDIESHVYKGYQAGAIDYIRKPIIPELLRVKVRAFVELSEKNRELIRKEEKLRRANQRLEIEITERKHSEQKINALNRDLQLQLEQVQTLDFFNHSVSHELMGPLNSIRALVGLILGMPAERVDRDIVEIVHHITRSVDNMSHLIRGLLAFSRELQNEIERTSCSMDLLVADVVKDITITMPAGKTEIVIQQLPVEWCDALMLKQVWTNLISNAIKYSQRAERPRVEIGVRMMEERNVYYVKDNGVGFDMQHYSKLFGLFSRLHADSEFKGTGIGLALVKRIVERHGGKIWAQSTPGIGTEFYFTVAPEGERRGSSGITSGSYAEGVGGMTTIQTKSVPTQLD